MVVLRRDIGTAHSGFSDWYLQRLSAVVLAVLLPLPFVLLWMVYDGALDQFGLFDVLDHFVSRLLHTVLILALIIHAYVGLKVILEDYVHNMVWRVPLIGLMLVVTASFGIWWMALIWAWGH